jgi:acyl-CoA synthetase (AMP-forming)/AMP-acid ligase II
MRDRVKDMIVSGGDNIYPAEVESVLSTHPDIASTAVIGIPSNKWGETVLAVVVPAADGVTKRDIIEHCRTRSAHYKCPTSVTCVDSLSISPSDKVLNRELREPYRTGTDRRVHS